MSGEELNRKVFISGATDKAYPHPVNKMSALVLSQTEEIEPEYKINRVHSLERLPTTQFLGKKEHDLTGMKKGTLTVVGVFLKQNGKAVGNTRWVVLCACGYYEVRSTRGLKNEKNTLDCCTRCQKNNKM